MAVLNKEQILATKSKPLPTEAVPVPEWGGDVIVKTLTGRERDAFEDSCVDRRGKQPKQVLANVRAKLCALCIVDEQGARLFSDTEAVELGQTSAAALDRVFSVAQRLNGMSQKDVEDLSGNSEPGQSDGSTSV